MPFGFWISFAINEALSLVSAFLASNKLGLKTTEVQALEAWITQTQALINAF